MKNLIFSLSCAVFMTVAFSFAPAVRGAETRPNIVFIFSDDHAQQAIGAYGVRLSEVCRKQGASGGPECAQKTI